MSPTREHLISELKELGAIVLYLAISFVLIATGKSLVLIQVGINDFVHGYVKAIIESLALGKIVMLAQTYRFWSEGKTHRSFAVPRTKPL